MRNAIVGALVVGSVGLAVLCTGSRPNQVFGDPVSLHRTGKSNDLITFSAPAGDGKQQLTVIDPETRAMGVYHVDTSSGEIVLKSVRTLYWDLQMVEFNTTSPTPAEIRTLLERK